MAARPDDLTRYQINYIIALYEALPNGQLDATIKADLKEYKKYIQKISTIDTQINAEKQALALAIGDLQKKINRLETKARFINDGISLFEDNIVDRHFELNGELPPVEPAPVVP